MSIGTMDGDAGGLAERTLRWFSDRPWRRFGGASAAPVAWPDPISHLSWRQTMYPTVWFEDPEGEELPDFEAPYEPWDSGLVRFVGSIGAVADLPAVTARLRGRAATELETWGRVPSVLSAGQERSLAGLLADRRDDVGVDERRGLADLWCGCLSYVRRLAITMAYRPDPLNAAALMHALAVCEAAAAFIRGRPDDGDDLRQAVPTWFAILRHADRDDATGMAELRLTADARAAAEVAARGMLAMGDLGDLAWLLTATVPPAGSAGAEVKLAQLCDSFLTRALLPPDLTLDEDAAAPAGAALTLEGWMMAAARLLPLLMPSVPPLNAATSRPAINASQMGELQIGASEADDLMAGELEAGESGTGDLRTGALACHSVADAAAAFAAYACAVAPPRGIAFVRGDAAATLPARAAALARRALPDRPGDSRHTARLQRIDRFAKLGVRAGQREPLADRPIYVALLQPILDDPGRFLLNGLAGTSLASLAAPFATRDGRPDEAIGFAVLAVLALLQLAAEAHLAPTVRSDGRSTDDGSALAESAGVIRIVKAAVRPHWLARAAVDLDRLSGAPFRAAEHRQAIAIAAAMLLAAALAFRHADQRSLLIQLLERTMEPAPDGVMWRDHIHGGGHRNWSGDAPADADSQRIEAEARRWLSQLTESHPA